MRFLNFIGVALLSISLLTCDSASNDQPNQANMEGGNKQKISVSGIYPHLTMYNPQPAGVGESGIGVLAPWAGKLWALTYPAHQPFGSHDKLYEIDSALHMTVRAESVGGTHANRMIHQPSGQLIMGPYFISKEGKVRSISPKDMPGRLTGVTPHLTDPENKVLFYTMEEGLYEADVHTLQTKLLYADGNAMNPPDVANRLLPGYHGKGAYTGQGRLVVANNGELNWETVKTSGALAEWDGKKWSVIENKQFTEVTGPGGIYGYAKENDPIWTIGWDEKSLILKLLENGQWHDFRLPKASFTYDGAHGWHTEWPRIREINDGRWLMTMHGMFWDFPKTFSMANTGGIKPLSSYLRIIPDFAYWNNQLVFACDDASWFDNTLVGRPHSNLWFVKPEDLQNFGPKYGFGGVWLNENIEKNKPSTPFLSAGFSQKVLHISHQSNQAVNFIIEYTKDGSNTWQALQQVSVPAKGYQYFIFPPGFEATWVRLQTDKASKGTSAYFAFSESKEPVTSASLFKSLPEAGTDKSYSFGLIRPGANEDISLQFVAFTKDAGGNITETGYYEANEQMELYAAKNDTAVTWLKENIKIKNPDFTVDNASVVVTDAKGNRYRLPKGDSRYDKFAEQNAMRGIREVATERSLFNCHGSFYELPREISGGVSCIKPIATHNRLIHDFCSWRGMMVIAGNLTDAATDGHYFKSTDGKAGLWFGTIDDLWKLGKPVGKGGPWNETAVKANVPSDPYLMTGYDQKKLTLSHQSSKPVTITAEVDLTANGKWVVFDTFQIEPGKSVDYEFPEGYQAHWIRFKASEDCKATAQLIYE